MKRCPISYESCEKNYSPIGLKNLNKKLVRLEIFPYSADEQRKEAFFKSAHLSIQGIHPKLSSSLNVNKDGEGCFEIAEKNGNFILKPQSDHLYELPQNEDITMRLAESIGIETPLHGLIYCKGGSFTYFIKRFDRINLKEKIEVEDFAALAGKSRDTKYDFTMEGIADILNAHCTFPALEKYKLFKLTIFNFLVGNEDMHLKNFSLVRRDNKIELSPAYDLVNSSIAMGGNVCEELALPLNGKRKGLTKADFIDYYGVKVLKMADKSLKQALLEIENGYESWETMINKSFLSDMMKQTYLRFIKERKKRVF